MKKVFKKMFLTSILLLSPTFLLSSCGGDDVIEPEDDLFSIKTDFNSEQGNVTLDKTSGKVGEKVKATISPKEGYKISGIEFNEETLTAATSLELTPVKGENTLTVKFESSTSVEKLLVLSGTYKTEYKVGETLSFEGLEVKLVTKTNGVSDEGVAFTNYKTDTEAGYKFVEGNITNVGETFDVVIFAEDPTITSAILELTVKAGDVEEVNMTPANFLREMKKTERYTVESAETKGVYIPNANYWTAKESSYDSFGYAQNGKEIMLYQIVGDHYLEKTTYSQTDPDLGYDGMYDQKFEDYLVDKEEIYHNRGIGFITDEEINNYEATLKPSATNPNVYTFKISSDMNSHYARDIVQLTYNGNLALNDFGLTATMGYNVQVKLTILSKKQMQIDILNSTEVRYWPIKTVITLDETADIPQIKPFLEGKEEVNPDLVKAKVAFDLLRQGNFQTSLNDTFTPNYVFRSTTNSADFTKETEFTYKNVKYTAGNYRASFNTDGSVKELSAIEVGGYNDVTSNSMLNNDESYLTFFNEEANTLSLTYYANADTSQYLMSIPELYCGLFNIDINKTEEDTKFRNINFLVHFTDKECTIVDCITVKFGRESGNKLIELKNFGTSKVDYVDTFINSLK